MNNLGTITLETERLILRKFEINDATLAFNNWFSDPECNKYVSYDLHQNVLETKELIEKLISKYNENYYNWVIELKSTHEIIGNITANHVSKKNLNCEVGYSFGSKFWGHGYATEALKKVIDFFLNDCNLYLVEAYHSKSNEASERVMEKAGMKKEATLRSRAMNKITNELEDLICYSITKDDII